LVEEHRSLPIGSFLSEPYRSPYDLVWTESGISLRKGVWVGPGIGQDMCRKSGAQRDPIPRPFSRQRVAILPALSQPTTSMLNLLNHEYMSSGITPSSPVHIDQRFTEIRGFRNQGR
jgi:hypothetical protein